jgi:hypothetical protein
MRRSIVVLLLVAGCGHGLCARHSDCPAQEMCSPAGVCVVETAGDAGTDATSDASARGDAGPDAATDAPTDGG